MGPRGQAPPTQAQQALGLNTNSTQLALGLTNSVQPAAPSNDRLCLFLNNLFPSASASAFPTLARPRRRNCIRSVSTEPSRRSVKEATLKSTILVSQRATTCLIRQLDLADLGDQIAEEVFKHFADMFKARLAAKTIEAIRSTSRLVDDQVTKAAEAMVADEMAAQMELAAS
jgi:hypothetical protein